MTQNNGIVAKKREIIWQKKCVRTRREDQVRDRVVKIKARHPTTRKAALGKVLFTSFALKLHMNNSRQLILKEEAIC